MKLIKFFLCLFLITCFTIGNSKNSIAQFTSTKEGEFKNSIEYFKLGVWAKSLNFEWKVESEENIDFYLVEYSKKGKEFITLGRVKSIEESLIAQVYELNINNKYDASEGTYRLKQVMKDGSIQQTDLEYLTMKLEENRKEISITLTPNTKFKDENSLRLMKLEDDQIQLEVTDSRGYRIKSSVMPQTDNPLKKTSDYLSDLELPNGIYYLKISTPTRQLVRKFMVN